MFYGTMSFVVPCVVVCKLFWCTLLCDALCSVVNSNVVPLPGGRARLVSTPISRVYQGIMLLNVLYLALYFASCRRVLCVVESLFYVSVFVFWDKKTFSPLS